MARIPKKRAAGRPPEGEPWVWHTLSLISSPAWRARSINCARLLEFLEIEHLRHGGNENGLLLAPYTQLIEFGVTRRLIAPTIREAERLGLVRVERGGKKGTTVTEVSRYRLTYLWTKTRSGGLWAWHEPTDDWKSDTGDAIGPTSGTVRAPLREPVPAPHREPGTPQPIDLPCSAVAPLREPPSISRVGSGSLISGARGGCLPAASRQRATSTSRKLEGFEQ
jgi:hypothetical protein